MSCRSEETTPECPPEDNNLITNRHNTKACITTLCPSKLSKRELEELYFSLMDNNLELKKQVNTQDEKMRQMATKLQRVTATQKAYIGPGKDCAKPCCDGYKNVVEEQKHVIQDIQAANEKLTEHIKKLNIQLHSTRLFLKKNSFSNAPKKPGLQHGSAQQTTAAQTKPVAIVPKSVSSKTIISGKVPLSPRTTPKSQHNTSTPPKENRLPLTKHECTEECKKRIESSDSAVETAVAMIKENTCDANKCRTLMEDLRQKIIYLEQELNMTHEEYSSRISRLEQEVAEVTTENHRVNTERAIRDHILEQREKEIRQNAALLRAQQTTCGTNTDEWQALTSGRYGDLTYSYDGCVKIIRSRPYTRYTNFISCPNFRHDLDLSYSDEFLSCISVSSTKVSSKSLSFKHLLLACDEENNLVKNDSGIDMEHIKSLSNTFLKWTTAMYEELLM